MNDTAPQSALREWRTHMAQPARLAGLLGAAVILTLMGPFDTETVLRLVPRFIYWAVIVLVCYSAGYGGNMLGLAFAGERSSFARRLIYAGGITAVGVLLSVYVITGLGIGFWATGTNLAYLAANVTVISVIITAVFLMIDDAEASNAPTAPSIAPLMDRLPFDKRGPLVALSVEDHYVRILTLNGEEMVLMRLADAIRDVGQTHGLQVHRSHWVALNQVTAATRNGDGAILSMSLGPDIPVSRANVSKIKEAGLLPRT